MVPIILHYNTADSTLSVHLTSFSLGLLHLVGCFYAYIAVATANKQRARLFSRVVTVGFDPTQRTHNHPDDPAKIQYPNHHGVCNNYASTYVNKYGDTKANIARPKRVSIVVYEDRNDLLNHTRFTTQIIMAHTTIMPLHMSTNTVTQRPAYIDTNEHKLALSNRQICGF